MQEGKYILVRGRYALTKNEIIQMIRDGKCSKGKYHCRRCGRIHRTDSKIGRQHADYLDNIYCGCVGTGYCELRYGPVKRSVYRHELLRSVKRLLEIQEQLDEVLELIYNGIKDLGIIYRGGGLRLTTHALSDVWYYDIRLLVDVQIVNVKKIWFGVDVNKILGKIKELSEDDLQRMQLEWKGDKRVLNEVQNRFKGLEKLMNYMMLWGDKNGDS